MTIKQLALLSVRCASDEKHTFDSLLGLRKNLTTGPATLKSTELIHVCPNSLETMITPY